MSRLRSLLFAALAAVLLLIPSEHAAIAGIGRIAGVLGVRDTQWWWLISPTAIAAAFAAALWIVSNRPWERRPALVVATTFFVLSGVCAVVLLPITGGNFWLGVRDAWLGHIAPAILVLGILAMPRQSRRRLWTVWVAGGCAFIAAAFLAASVSHISPGWSALAPAERLVMWKFEMIDTSMLFTRWAGNANKTSNVLLLGLLLTPTLLELRSTQSKPDPRLKSDPPLKQDPWATAARIAGAAYLVLATLMLVLLFSRACLLLLPFVLLAAGWWNAYPGRRQRVAMLVGALGLAALLLGVSTTRNVLLHGDYPGTPTQGFLSTYASEGGRLEQASEALALMSTQQHSAMWGLGAGQHGINTHGDAAASTHNYILDIWLAGGIPALVLTLGWIAVCIVVPIVTRRASTGLLGLVAITVLLLLMTREYTAAYLSALSMGGIYLVLVIAAATGSLAPRRVETSA